MKTKLYLLIITIIVFTGCSKTHNKGREIDFSSILNSSDCIAISIIDLSSGEKIFNTNDEAEIKMFICKIIDTKVKRTTVDSPDFIEGGSYSILIDMRNGNLCLTDNKTMITDTDKYAITYSTYDIPELIKSMQK